MSIIEVKLRKNGIEYNGVFNTMKAWGQVTKDGVLIETLRKPEGYSECVDGIVDTRWSPPSKFHKEDFDILGGYEILEEYPEEDEIPFDGIPDISGDFLMELWTE